MSHPKGPPPMTQHDSDATTTEPTMISWQRDDDLVILTMDDPGAP